MRTFPARRAVLALLALVLGLALLTPLLPTDPYLRYQLLEGTIYDRSRWIYERIHFDPAPIDVAFVGSSRTGAGISAPHLQARLAAAGVPAGVANFSMPENGRDLHWIIEKEMLSAKKPRLIVILVIEKPGRFGHPAYRYLAPTADVIDPGYLANIKYPGNIIAFPYRQFRLVAGAIAPETFGMTRQFDPARYAGTGYDTTVSFTTGDGDFIERDKVVPAATLAEGVRRYEKGVNPPILKPDLADLEFGDERTNIARMAKTAAAQGSKIAFLFLPYYTGPHTIQERRFYERFGPVLDASFISDQSQYYSDAAHLNHAGALVISDWLAPRIAALLAERPAQPATAGR